MRSKHYKHIVDVLLGGGRFGQSLTAIAKLAPQAVIAPGLSVHYSGGSGLPDDVRAWLESRGLPVLLNAGV